MPRKRPVLTSKRPIEPVVLEIPVRLDPRAVISISRVKALDAWSQRCAKP